MNLSLFQTPGTIVFLDDDPGYLDMLSLVLPQDWRLLGGMCGANGFMIFGFVIAMLVEALRHVRLGQIEGRRRK